MPDHEISSTLTPLNAYDAGVKEARWSAPTGESASQLFPHCYCGDDPLPEKRPAADAEDFGRGLHSGAAASLNQAVHVMMIVDAEARRGLPLAVPPDIYSGYYDHALNSDTDPAGNVWQRSELATAVDMFGRNVMYVTGDKDLEQLSRAPEMKQVLPQITMVELQSHFDDVHQKSDSGGITRDELRGYVDHCKEGQDMLSLAAAYALEHFDSIRKLGGNSAGITKDALATGIKQFGDMELEAIDIKNRDQNQLPDPKVLDFLSANFDHIRAQGSSGIDSSDLRLYFSHNCDDALESAVKRNFDKVRAQDPSDGDKNWYTLGLTRSNSDDITRSDIDKGLAAWAADQARSKEITSTFADWAKAPGAS